MYETPYAFRRDMVMEKYDTMEDLIFCSGKNGDAYNSGLFISRNSEDPLYMDGTANCFSKLDEVDEVLPRANLTKFGGLFYFKQEEGVMCRVREPLYPEIDKRVCPFRLPTSASVASHWSLPVLI